MLGRHVGATQQQVSKWEKDEWTPEAHNLERLAAVLEAPLEEFKDLALDAEKRARQAAERERAEQAREVDRLVQAMKVFAEQYEEFHGEYRQIAQRVGAIEVAVERIERLLTERLGESPPPPDEPPPG